MTAPALRPGMTAQEYLDFTDEAEGRFELVAGGLVELMSATDRHDVLVAEVLFQLLTALLDGPCRVYLHNRRLKVGENFREPDLLVVCSPPGNAQYEVDGETVVEVLSPGTEKVDLTEKLTEYRSLPSLREYLVLDPDTEHAYLYRRHDLGWYVEEPGGVVRLAGVDVDLAAAFAVVDRKLTAAG